MKTVEEILEYAKERRQILEYAKERRWKLIKAINIADTISHGVLTGAMRLFESQEYEMELLIEFIEERDTTQLI